MFGFLKNLFGCKATCCTATTATPTEYPFNTAAAIIEAKLSDPDYEFRKFDTLQKAVPGITRENLLATLNHVGARQAYRNGNLWGLKSRVGNRARRRYSY